MASTKHSNLFMITIYTDGACSGNPGAGGVGMEANKTYIIDTVAGGELNYDVADEIAKHIFDGASAVFRKDDISDR